MSLVISSTGRGRDPTTWLDRALRLTAIEVVAVYGAAMAALVPGGALALGLTGVGLGATAAVLVGHARRHRLRAPLAQHLVRGLSFLAWALAIARPLGDAVDPRGAMAATVLIPTLGAFLFPGSGGTDRPPP